MTGPILVVNPSDDSVFGGYAEVLVEHGATSVIELERRLRLVYPRASVRARELTNELFVVWYVYREGHWVDRRLASPSGVEGIDVGSAQRPPFDGGIDPSGRPAGERAGGGEGRA